MIQLFNVNNHKIDTSKFSNLLHDGIVEKFEKKLGKGFFTKGDNLSNKPGTIFSRTLGID